MLFRNSKGAAQSAHKHNLINAIVFNYLDNMSLILSKSDCVELEQQTQSSLISACMITCYIQKLNTVFDLVSVAEPYLLVNSQDRFVLC